MADTNSSQERRDPIWKYSKKLRKDQDKLLILLEQPAEPRTAKKVPCFDDELPPEGKLKGLSIAQAEQAWDLIYPFVYQTIERVKYQFTGAQLTEELLLVWEELRDCIDFIVRFLVAYPEIVDKRRERQQIAENRRKSQLADAQRIANVIDQKYGLIRYEGYVLRVCGSPKIPEPTSQEGGNIIQQAIQYIGVTGTSRTHEAEQLLSDEGGTVSIAKEDRYCGSKVLVELSPATPH